MKLFCFPYAGGSEAIFYSLKKGLKKGIELIPVEFAGKGIRTGEKPYGDINEMVEDAIKFIKSKLNNGEEFGLLGYSMGSLIAYETASILKSREGLKTKKMYFLASIAPSEKRRKINVYDDDRFVDELVSIGGMSKEILEDKEVLDYFLPIIKNDFDLLNRYEYKKKYELIDSDSYVMYSHDEVERGDIFKWNDLIEGEVNYLKFDGGHFFINQYSDKIVKTINDTIVH